MIPSHALAPDNDPVIFTDLHAQPLNVTSPDGTVTLHLDSKEFDFYLDIRPRALGEVIEGFDAIARRLGFMPMPEDEDPPEFKDGALRSYYVPIEPMGDADWAMPSLVPTAFGPFSMEIPAIDLAAMQEEIIELDDEWSAIRDAELQPASGAPTGPIAIPRPPLPYAPLARPPARRYEQTPTGPRRRGRHRAQ